MILEFKSMKLSKSMFNAFTVMDIPPMTPTLVTWLLKLRGTMCVKMAFTSVIGDPVKSRTAKCSTGTRYTGESRISYVIERSQLAEIRPLGCCILLGTPKAS
jgi:hypothetical protein